MSLAIGQEIADLTFQTPDGTAVRLHGFRGRPLLVVFLRHLA
jgi:peroxiredoxin